MENFVVMKSKNSRADLFPLEARDKWGSIFNKKVDQIIKWGFSVRPSREMLCLYNRTTPTVHIFAMKDILKYISKEVIFTKGGANIGKSISFQRKGGNGSLSKHIPKTSIKHPGNNIQLKLRPKKLIEELKNIELARYQI